MHGKMKPGSVPGDLPCRKEDVDGRKWPPALVHAPMSYIDEQSDIMTALDSRSLLQTLRLLPNITTIDLDQSWKQPTSWDPLWPKAVNGVDSALQLIAKPDLFFHLVCNAMSSLHLFPKSISYRESDKNPVISLAGQIFPTYIPRVIREDFDQSALRATFSAARYVHMTMSTRNLLVFPNIDGTVASTFDLRYTMCSLPDVLGAASDLEELELHIFPIPHTGDRQDCGLLKDHLVGKHTWPKLRKASFTHCDIRGPDLTSFISRHQLTLRKLVLENVAVRANRRKPYPHWSWARIIEHMRTWIGSGALDDLDLRLYSVKDSGSEPNKDPQPYGLYSCPYTYCFDSDDLRSFFKDDGPNPFLLGDYSVVAEETEDEDVDDDNATNGDYSDPFADLHI